MDEFTLIVEPKFGKQLYFSGEDLQGHYTFNEFRELLLTLHACLNHCEALYYSDPANEFKR